MLELVNTVMPIFIVLLMAGVGLSISWPQLFQALTSWRIIAATILSMQIALTGICIIAAKLLALSPEVAVGMVLLSSCPGGLFSNYLVFLAKGDAALSIALTVVVTLVYTFVAPLWAAVAIWLFMADANLARGYDPIEVLLSLIGFVLIPVIFSVSLRTKRPTWALKLGAIIRNPSAAGLLILYITLMYLLRDTLVLGLKASIVPVLLFNFFGFLLSIAIGRMLYLSRQKTLPVIVEHLVRQEGTGIYIASALIGSAVMTYPMLLNSLTGVVLSLLFVALQSRKKL